MWKIRKNVSDKSENDLEEDIRYILGLGGVAEIRARSL